MLQKETLNIKGSLLATILGLVLGPRDDMIL